MPGATARPRTSLGRIPATLSGTRTAEPGTSDAKIILRMTLAERHAIDEAARRSGVKSAAEWARRVLLDATNA